MMVDQSGRKTQCFSAEELICSTCMLESWQINRRWDTSLSTCPLEYTHYLTISYLPPVSSQELPSQTPYPSTRRSSADPHDGSPCSWTYPLFLPACKIRVSQITLVFDLWVMRTFKKGYDDGLLFFSLALRESTTYVEHLIHLKLRDIFCAATHAEQNEY